MPKKQLKKPEIVKQKRPLPKLANEIDDRSEFNLTIEARRKAPRALKVVEEIMEKKGSSDDTKLRAAKMILEQSAERQAITPNLIVGLSDEALQGLMRDILSKKP